MAKLVRFYCSSPKCDWEGERGPSLKKCPDCGKRAKRSARRPTDQKRRARRETSQEVVEKHGEVWGLGGEHQEKQNNRLIRQSLRWRTDATTSDLNVPPEEMKAKEIALLVTRRNMLNSDPGIANNAVRNLVSMEAQNQRDDQEREPTQHQHLHLHDNPYIDAPMETILAAKLALADLEEASVEPEDSPSQVPGS